MTFAKHVGQPPQFDAGAFGKHAGLTPADVANFQRWKQFVGGELVFDGTGLRDVVEANAQALDLLKTDLDNRTSEITLLEEKVAALEARPAVPFPASSPRTGGA